MSLTEELRASSRKWAAASLEAYYAERPDYHFVIHHMAVAVEHISKAYLCSITEVLLIGDKPNVEDLLILGGHSDKTRRGYADLKTVSGSDAIARAEKLLNKQASDPQSLKQLREVRNGVTHLAQGADPAQVRVLLAAAIDFVNDLLDEMDHPRDSFWGEYEEMVNSIALQAVTDLQLRYANKLKRAKANFEQRFGSMREPERSQAITALSSVPVLARWGMVSPEKCPACGSPAMVSGRDYDDGYGAYFSPRFFGCRVCDLRLQGDELSQAGFRPGPVEPSPIFGDLFDQDDGEDGDEAPGLT